MSFIKFRLVEPFALVQHFQRVSRIVDHTQPMKSQVATHCNSRTCLIQLHSSSLLHGQDDPRADAVCWLDLPSCYADTLVRTRCYLRLGSTVGALQVNTGGHQGWRCLSGRCGVLPRCIGNAEGQCRETTSSMRIYSAGFISRSYPLIDNGSIRRSAFLSPHTTDPGWTRTIVVWV
jgi:hypothetical protein